MIRFILHDSDQSGEWSATLIGCHHHQILLFLKLTPLDSQEISSTVVAFVPTTWSNEQNGRAEHEVNPV